MESNKLIKDIKIEFEMMDLVVNEVEQLITEIGDNEPTNVQKTAMGAFASQIYNGIENLFKRIYKHNQIELPKGENWHIDLINSFSMNSKITLPFKLPPELIKEIHNYRRLRHYFVHGYTLNLNWNILKDTIKEIRKVYFELKIIFKI